MFDYLSLRRVVRCSAQNPCCGGCGLRPGPAQGASARVLLPLHFRDLHLIGPLL